MPGSGISSMYYVLNGMYNRQIKKEKHVGGFFMCTAGCENMFYPCACTYLSPGLIKQLTDHSILSTSIWCNRRVATSLLATILDIFVGLCHLFLPVPNNMKNCTWKLYIKEQGVVTLGILS